MVPLQLGRVGVKDGQFLVTEFKLVEATETREYVAQIPLHGRN